MIQVMHDPRRQELPERDLTEFRMQPRASQIVACQIHLDERGDILSPKSRKRRQQLC
jgi:hypothetical protein